MSWRAFAWPGRNAVARRARQLASAVRRAARPGPPWRHRAIDPRCGRTAWRRGCADNGAKANIARDPSCVRSGTLRSAWTRAARPGDQTRQEREDGRHREKCDPDHRRSDYKCRHAHPGTAHVRIPVIGALEQDHPRHCDDGSDEARDGDDENARTQRAPPGQAQRPEERGKSRTDREGENFRTRRGCELAPPFPICGPGFSVTQREQPNEEQAPREETADKRKDAADPATTHEQAPVSPARTTDGRAYLRATGAKI